MTDGDSRWRRFRDLVRRRATDDVDDEVRYHLERRREEAIRAGEDPDRADALARERFGDVESVVAELYAIDTSRERKRNRAEWFADLLQDVRFALRSLSRARSFSVTVVLTLALAIGANTTIFSFVHALLLAPLPYRAPHELVTIQAGIIGSAGEMLALRERTSSFSDIALFRNRSITFKDEGDAARLDGIAVTANLIRMLGVAPALGSAFDDDASTPGAGNVILLSHSLWIERYGGDRGIVGRRVLVDGVDCMIAGVMPSSFNFPSAGARFWIPVTIDPGNITATWAFGGAGFIARLEAGVSVERATAELTAVVPGMRRLNPRWDPGEQYGAPAIAEPLQESLVSAERPALLLLMACVAVVLLVACVNIANLMLARVTVRQGEFMVRAALGGGRARLIRQLLTESVAMSLISGALGVVIAFGGVRLGLAAVPATLVRTSNIHISVPVLAFTAGLAILTGIAFGLLPALRAVSARGPIHGGAARLGRGTIGEKSRQRISGILVAGEVALAVLLAIVAGLLTRSFDQLRNLSPGFRAEQVVSARISPPPAIYGGTNTERTSAFYQMVIDRLSATPGVSDVGVVDRLPIAAPVFGMGVRVEGQFEDGTQLLPMANHVQVVNPGYLRVLGIPLLRGRAFDDGDHAAATPVALVSQSFARRFWPNDDALGKRIGYPYPSPWITIVGVVADVKLDSLRDTSADAVMIPFEQRQRLVPPEMFVVVRSNADPAAIGRQLRAIVDDIDRTVPVTGVCTMNDVLAQSVERPRFTMSLVALFALATLMLGATGIYGVMSYLVSQRAQEMGLRMALGATSRDIVRLVVGRGAALAVAGAAAGCVAALLTTQLLTSLLYGVSTTDPLTFATAVALFVGVAIAASAGPARRATRSDPVATLRG